MHWNWRDKDGKKLACAGWSGGAALEKFQRIFVPVVGLWKSLSLLKSKDFSGWNVSRMLAFNSFVFN